MLDMILEQGLDYILSDKETFDDVAKFEKLQQDNRSKIVDYFMNIKDNIKLEATKETSSVEDPKYALSSYAIIHDSSIFLHFLTSILFLIIQFLLDLRQLALYSISDKAVNLACIRS